MPKIFSFIIIKAMKLTRYQKFFNNRIVKSQFNNLQNINYDKNCTIMTQKLKISVVFSCLLFVLLNTNTVTAQWESSGPEGGFMRGIIHSNDTLYALAGTGGKSLYTSVDDGNSWSQINVPIEFVGQMWGIGKIGNSLLVIHNGLYRSDDYGQTWEQISNQLINNILVTNDGAIFAAITTSDILLRSTDRGNSWTVVNNGLSGIINTVSVMIANETTIFACTADYTGVFRSTDNGDTWTEANNGLAFYFEGDWYPDFKPNFKCMGFNGTDIYIGNDGEGQGIWRSTDNGDNWSFTNTETRNYDIYSVGGNGSSVFAATLVGGVIRSTDDGATWATTNNGISIYQKALAMSVSDQNVFVGTQDGVYKTIDNGTNWTKMSEGIFSHEFTSNNIHNIGTEVFIGSRFGGVFRSSDGGLNWIESNNNLPVNDFNNLISINVTSNTLFAATYFPDNVYYSNDLGNTWDIPNCPGTNFGGKLWIEHNQGLYAIKPSNGVYRSLDNDQTWALINNGIQNPSNSGFGFIESDGTTLYVGATTGIYYSTNNGDTWTLGNFPNLNVSQLFFNGASFASTESACFVGLAGYGGASTYRGIYTSIDNGANWIKKNDLLVHKFVVDNDIIYASGKNIDDAAEILVSQDNGESWTLIAQDNIQTYSIAAGNSLVFYAKNNPTPNASIFVSDDYGTNWMNGSEGLSEYTFVTSLNVIQNQIFAATNGNSVWQRGLDEFLAPSQPSPIAGSLAPCVGSVETYSVDNVTGVTFTWQFPTDWIVLGGAGTNEITVEVGTQSGVIIVTPSNNFGTGPAQALSVTPVPIVPAGVSIMADNNPSCPGFEVNYTATPINGGNPFYQWYVNEVSVGTDQATYSYIPDNDDQVYVVMTSDLSCITDNPATSDTITMVVSDLNPVSVTITADQNNVCESTIVNFLAIPVAGGNAPVYQWYVNGVFTGNGETYSYSPSDGDQVFVILTSSLECTTGNPAVSNLIQMQVSPYIDVTATIAITQNNLCEGSEFNFTSATTGGGNTPQYQWMVNGAQAGENMPEFAYIAENGDEINLIFTSGETCTTQNPVTSNAITAVVNPLPEVSWPGFEPDTLCIEDWSPVTLTGATPAGGTYNGDGVVGNTFDPALAGVGSHEITYTYSNSFGCTNQSSLFLFVDVCLGVSEKEAGLLVYPNPVYDNLMVKMLDNSSIQQLTLTNMLGIQVYQNENPDTNQAVSIPVQNLPSGNYLLRVISNSKSVFKKVIIK